MLVDGSSLIFRAYYGVRPTFSSPGGEQINAVRGFFDRLGQLLLSRRPARIAIASDEDWRPRHRVDMIPSYKSHRVDEPIPPALIPQMDRIRSLLTAIGIDFIGAPELEAEDVIASWVEQMSGRIEIVSGDRDLFALIRDPDVKVLYPEKAGLAEVDEAEVCRRYGIPGRRYMDFAVLRGDPSDGLPGLNGVGAVTAASMIRKYGGLDGLIASGVLSAKDLEYVVRARAVVRPGAPSPIAVPDGRAFACPMDEAALRTLVDDLGIQETISSFLRIARSTLTASLDHGPKNQAVPGQSI